jgi:polyphenol oxidase
MDWHEQDGVRWLEADLPRARACFSTRRGGISQGAFASLNLGFLTDDDQGRVAGNRARLAHALRLDPAHVLVGHQVHGATVLRHQAPQVPPGYAQLAPDPPEVDGHATDEPGLAPLVLVADCLPVALSGPGGVAMLHCGWRGLAGGIVERGVEEVDARAAAVGPGIGPCCYQVGREVLEAFDELGEGVAADGMLDLPEVAERLLRRAGVERVERADLCTSCERELFFSHRRDAGMTGRQAGTIVATGPWPS